MNIDNDYKKTVFQLLEKLRGEEYESIYEDLIYDIKAEDEA